MKFPLEFGILAFSTLFAMVNPLSAAPIFVAITASEADRRRQIALRASLVTLIALVLFSVAGHAIFAFFGITVPAFQIVGGLILLLSSLRTMNGAKDEEVQQSGGDVAIVPIGIPLLAGAGALSSVMVLAGQAQHRTEQMALLVAILGLAGSTFVILAASPRVIRMLGKAGEHALSSVMTLLTAVIGVQFILNGLTSVVNGFRG